MEYYEFFDRLTGVSSAYHWDVDHNKVEAVIRSGPNQGRTLNPVTALAHKSGFGLFDNTRDGTEQAASLLGCLERQQGKCIVLFWVLIIEEILKYYVVEFVQHWRFR